MDDDTGLAHLQDYVTQNGRQPQRTTKHRGFELGEWCALQRSRRVQGRLPGWLSQRLEATPYWTWEPVVAQWDSGFAALQQYMKTAAAPPPPGTVSGGYRLGTWCECVRRAQSAGTLPARFVAELESVPGWPWPARARPLRDVCGRRGCVCETVDYIRDYVLEHSLHLRALPTNARFAAWRARCAARAVGALSRWRYSPRRPATRAALAVACEAQFSAVSPI